MKCNCRAKGRTFKKYKREKKYLKKKNGKIIDEFNCGEN